jgi:hypothetical protein
LEVVSLVGNPIDACYHHELRQGAVRFIVGQREQVMKMKVLKGAIHIEINQPPTDSRLATRSSAAVVQLSPNDLFVFWILFDP